MTRRPIDSAPDFQVCNFGKTFFEPSRIQGQKPKTEIADVMLAIALGLALALVLFFGLSR